MNEKNKTKKQSHLLVQKSSESAANSTDIRGAAVTFRLILYVSLYAEQELSLGITSSTLVTPDGLNMCTNNLISAFSPNISNQRFDSFSDCIFPESTQTLTATVIQGWSVMYLELTLEKTPFGYRIISHHHFERPELGLILKFRYADVYETGKLINQMSSIN